MIGRLPDAVLFTVTAVLSSFMLSGELPAIRTWLQKLARPEWLEKLQRLGGHVRTTLGGWLRAQLKLMGITFLILNVGLLVLRVRYPLLAALVGALFIGVGVGLGVRMGGASGGDDALAMSIEKLTGIGIQWVYLVEDLIVLTLSLSYIPLRRIAYSLLTVILSGQLIGLVAKKKPAAPDAGAEQAEEL